MSLIKIIGALTVIVSAAVIARELTLRVDSSVCYVSALRSLLEHTKNMVDCYSLPASEILRRTDKDIFADCGFVTVVGTSKGKGFQGVVKRHGFGGVGQTTHGQHNRLRAPGSIGACSYPARVFKGTRMAGQMGNHRVTVQNLQVLNVMPEHNLLVIKGSVPGCKGSIVIIEK